MRTVNKGFALWRDSGLSNSQWTFLEISIKFIIQIHSFNLDSIDYNNSCFLLLNQHTNLSKYYLFFHFLPIPFFKFIFSKLIF